MEEMGLAQGMAQQPQPTEMGIEELVAMIMQGVTPEELVAQGVPEELVMQAMQIVSEEATKVPAGQVGLAGQIVRPETGM